MATPIRDTTPDTISPVEPVAAEAEGANERIARASEIARVFLDNIETVVYGKRDEINRATPKTQSALLEAMAEHQVTVDGVTRELPSPFLLLATENPIEYEGTFPLPEAQLDRFFLRAALGYPGLDDEVRILEEQRY